MVRIPDVCTLSYEYGGIILLRQYIRLSYDMDLVPGDQLIFYICLRLSEDKSALLET